MFTRMIGCLLVLAAFFSTRAIHAQQINPPRAVAVITCAEKPGAKPTLLYRLLHRTWKTNPVPFVFHEPDFGLLVPEMAARWRQDEAKRLGLHVPARFCASAALPGLDGIAINTAAASAARKQGTASRR